MFQNPVQSPSYYRSHQFSNAHNLPNSAFKNRELPQTYSEIPKGRQYFQPSNKKHYQNKSYRSQIQQDMLMRQQYPTQQDQKRSRILMDKSYFRSLNVDDIEGAKPNTLISKAVKNREKAQHFQKKQLSPKQPKQRNQVGGDRKYHLINHYGNSRPQMVNYFSKPQITREKTQSSYIQNMDNLGSADNKNGLNKSFVFKQEEATSKFNRNKSILQNNSKRILQNINSGPGDNLSYLNLNAKSSSSQANQTCQALNSEDGNNGRVMKNNFHFIKSTAPLKNQQSQQYSSSIPTNNGNQSSNQSLPQSPVYSQQQLQNLNRLKLQYQQKQRRIKQLQMQLQMQKQLSLSRQKVINEQQQREKSRQSRQRYRNERNGSYNGQKYSNYEHKQMQKPQQQYLSRQQQQYYLQQQRQLQQQQQYQQQYQQYQKYQQKQHQQKQHQQKQYQKKQHQQKQYQQKQYQQKQYQQKQYQQKQPSYSKAQYQPQSSQQPQFVSNNHNNKSQINSSPPVSLKTNPQLQYQYQHPQQIYQTIDRSNIRKYNPTYMSYQSEAVRGSIGLAGRNVING